MTDLATVYDILSQSTYCIKVKTKSIYYIFLKGLVEKYLADNYFVYIASDNINAYKTVLPDHPRLHYVSDELIPVGIGGNANEIYFYDNKESKPSKAEQLELVSYVESHAMKYIYVGNVCNLLPYTLIKLFRYYLHFQITTKKWQCIHASDILTLDNRYKMPRKYYGQLEKKKITTKPIFLYDFFVMHDLMLDETRIYKFNKKLFTPKPQNIPAAPAALVENIEPKVVVKYIYTTKNNSRDSLIMPDGSRENYNDLVQKYSNLIEV